MKSEETKAYNKRHSIEVKVALDVLRQYVIGLDNVKDHRKYTCDYCIMQDVCFELFGACCPVVFEYHRDATTDEITCVQHGSDCDVIADIALHMEEDHMIDLWRALLERSLSLSMIGDGRGMYLLLKNLSRQLLIRTKKYSNNEAALEKFYDECEKEVEDEANGVGCHE